MLLWVALLLGEALALGVIAAAIVRALRRKHRRQAHAWADASARVRHALSPSRVTMLSVDGDGTIQWYEGAAIPALGLARSSCLARPIAEVLADWPQWRRAILACLGGERTALDLAAEGAALRIHCTPRFDDAGRVAEANVLAIDRTEEAAEAGRAERLAEVRSRTLAVMSHRLRARLNGVLGPIELADAAASIEEGRPWLRSAQVSAEQLLSYVEHLVDFLELDAERMTPLPRPFSLRRSVEAVRSSLEDEARALGVTLVVRYPPSLQEDFVADEPRVRRILELVTGVAVRTNPGGQVILSVDLPSVGAELASVRVSIEDSGRGLSKDAAGRVFHAFESQSAMWSIRSGGSGLELPIAKRLARLVGGDLIAESTPGAGTTISFVAEWERTAPVAAGHDLAAAGEQPATRSILVVDDDATQRATARGLLEHLGHRVTLAADGAEALRLIDDQEFDAILTELHMPSVDGFALAAAVRARDDERRSIPIVALSADVRPESIADALGAGIDGHLAKPLRLSTLPAQLSEHLARASTAAESDARPDRAIDGEALARLRAVDADAGQEVAEQLIEAFIATTPRQLLEIRDAAYAGDDEVLERLLLRLDTSARLVGARRMRRLIGDLRGAVQAEDAQALRRSCSALTAEFELLKLRLPSYLAGEAA